MHTLRAWKFSSAGRASALQAEGHRFEPYNFHQKKDRKAFFYLPKASRAERGGGRLQGSAEGMVLITSTNVSKIFK